MMSSGAKLNLAGTSDRAQPLGCAHGPPKRAPGRNNQILQLKGFGGGVPLNTETAAVKPRAGIEKIARRCLFFVERRGREGFKMQIAECTMQNPSGPIFPR